MLKMYNLEEKGWDNLIKELKEREEEVSSDLTSIVSEILNKVSIEGDSAIKSYTEKFDKVSLESMEVSEEEIKECFESVDKTFIDNMKEAKDNIEFYHNAQKSRGFILNKANGV